MRNETRLNETSLSFSPCISLLIYLDLSSLSCTLTQKNEQKQLERLERMNSGSANEQTNSGGSIDVKGMHCCGMGIQDSYAVVVVC
jgi:hypothetical protein